MRIGFFRIIDRYCIGRMDALFAEMDAAGIWHMPLKGTVLQHLYPFYGMRQMSGHDIMFDAYRSKDMKVIMEGSVLVQSISESAITMSATKAGLKY